MMSLSMRSALRAFCIVALTEVLSAHAYAQSGPPADSCNANPVTCVPPPISIDQCASFACEVEVLPRTTSGKIDRRALMASVPEARDDRAG